MSFFDETEYGPNLSMLKHRITGETFMFGNDLGVSQMQADQWMRNYTLPLVGTINTRFLPDAGGMLEFRKVAIEDIRPIRLVSYMNSEDCEEIVNQLYGKRIQYNEGHLRLGVGKSMLLARYSGPRLEEGVKSLPEGGRMDFYIVRLVSEIQPTLA